MSLVSRLRVTSTAALFVAISLTDPFVARAEVTRAAANVASAPTIRIDNFGQVTEKYYRGAQPAGQDYTDLSALGVKTVIDLTSDDNDPDERRMTEQAGMKYCAKWMKDFIPEVPVEFVPTQEPFWQLKSSRA